MSNENVTTEATPEVTYPTTPDADGFFTANEDDASMNILTKNYDNGNIVKQATLPKSKQVAVVRELIAADTKDVSRFMDKDPEKYQMASITAATTLDGNKQPIEVIEKMKMSDYNILISMYQDLNF